MLPQKLSDYNEIFVVELRQHHESLSSEYGFVQLLYTVVITLTILLVINWKLLGLFQRQLKTWERLLESTWSFLTALIRWTSEAWVAFTKVKSIILIL